MRLHFAPIALIYVWRQNHQSIAACVGCGLCKGDGFARDKPGNRCHYRSAFPDSSDTSLNNLQFFFEGKRGTFSERSQRDNACTAVLQQPAAMIGHEAMID